MFLVGAVCAEERLSHTRRLYVAMCGQEGREQAQRRRSSTHRRRSKPRKGLYSTLPGHDASKNIKGRKRHILVHPLGLLLSIVVYPANVQDRNGRLRLKAASPQAA